MNKIYLIGNISSDVEKSTTSNGLSVCKFSVAVSRRFSKDKYNKETDFFNVVCWRALADNCANNLTKGKKVAVVGSIQMRKYQAQDGSTRTAVDVIAEEVEFLSPRSTENVSGGNQPAPVSGLQEDTTDVGLPF